jgi:hypothetical protein
MAEECGFSGNSDLYGLGIRLGVYIQWLTVMTAEYFHLTDVNSRRINYYAFSMALVIAIFYLMFQGTAYLMEIIILIFLFFGGLLSTDQVITHDLAPSWIMVYDFVMHSVMFGFCSWFWISGRDSNLLIPTPYGNTVFLLARVSPKHFGRVSRFFAAISIIHLVSSVLTIAYYGDVVRYIRALRAAREEPISVQDKAGWVQSLNRDLLPELHQILQASSQLSPRASARTSVARVERSYILLINQDASTYYCIKLRPPLGRLAELPARITDLYDAQQELAPYDDVHDMSPGDRVRASWVHFRTRMRHSAGKSLPEGKDSIL